MFQWLLLSLLSVAVCQCELIVDGFVSVTLSNGAEIRGLEKRTFYANRDYVSFKGIPYAEPPTGELRFRVWHFDIYFINIFLQIQNNQIWTKQFRKAANLVCCDNEKRPSEKIVSYRLQPIVDSNIVLQFQNNYTISV